MMITDRIAIAIAKLYFVFTTIVVVSAQSSVAASLSNHPFSFGNSNKSGATSTSTSTLRSLEDLEICVELSTECFIQGNTPGSTIPCEDFRSQSNFDNSSCKRIAILQGNATNIFKSAIAISYQINEGVAKTVLKAPGETETISKQIMINLCNNNNNNNNNLNENQFEISIFRLHITSGYRIGSSPLIKCQDTKKDIILKLPTNSPTNVPSMTMSPSLRPSIGENQKPPHTSSTAPSISPSHGIISNHPSQHPTHRNGNGGDVTNRPSSYPSHYNPRTPTSTPTKTFITTSAPSREECKVVKSKGGKGTKKKKKKKSTRTRTRTRTLQDLHGKGIKTKSPEYIKSSNGKGKGQSKGKGKGIGETKTKSPNGKGKGKGKGQSKGKGKGKGSKKTKSPNGKGKGKGSKGGKGKNKKCRSIAPDCDDLTNASVTVPITAQDLTLHYGLEIFTTNTNTNNNIQKSLNETVLIQVNNFFKAGLVGCNDDVQQSLDDVSIVSIRFVSLLIAGEQTEFEGLEQLCKNKPNKSEGLVCNKATGEIEIFILKDQERRLDMATEPELFRTLEEILNLYADTISGDSDTLVALHYNEISGDPYPTTPLSNGSTDGGEGSFKAWIFPLFVVMAVTILLLTAMVIRNNEGRWRDATNANSNDVRYVEHVSSKDVDLFLPNAHPDVEVVEEEEEEGNNPVFCFPIKGMVEDKDQHAARDIPIQFEITADDIRMQQQQSLAYDFTPVDLPLAAIEEEEVVQRRQLLRQYTIPTIVKDVDVDRDFVDDREEEYDNSSVGAQLCGDNDNDIDDTSLLRR